MATLSIVSMRKVVTNEYPGNKWNQRVKKMGDGQIIRLFYEFQKRHASAIIDSRLYKEIL